MDGQQLSESEPLAAENGRVTANDDREEGPRPQPEAKAGSFPKFYGKHRLQAAITHLNNQINSIQEELDQLETTGESSTVCKEVIASVESIPDPLLPWTEGSLDAGWDRWFKGAHNTRIHKRWI
ncbi:hypothetical protein L6164_024238 [Bauhinia variegata]|uniref:Uncharacterized protein n=1 Tax=Bauhinia variegata TaxID=167791 RepID=A0ACB9LXV4_BAUVA|nr:hypothetical protein L6164_024238 [Bauhinia variegata]